MKDHQPPSPAIPLLQSQACAAAIRALGGRARCRTLGGGGQVVIVSRPLPFGGEVRMVSRGPVFDPDTDRRDRIDLLRELKLHVVNAPDAAAGPILRAAGFAQVMTAATVAVLATRSDTETQLSMAHAKWRNAARQGLRAGTRVWMRRFDASRDRWLLERDLAQQRVRGYRALPQRMVLALAQVAPQDLRLAGADLDGRPIAAMLFIRHGTGATYQTGWSGAAGRQSRAHHAILTEAATRLHGDGVAQIELGLLDTVANPGLARFKLGAGAVPERLGGTWIRPPGWRG